MAALGITQGEEGSIDPDAIYLWPETIPVWGLWQSLQTQWNEGMGGRTGLNYPGVFALLDERRIRGRRRREAIECIQAAERAWLDVHNAAALAAEHKG